MRYIVNSSNYYFSVDQSVEMDCTILSCFGLKDFISKIARKLAALG